MCWLPMMITSCFHMAEVIDATPYYDIFSVILLPINSVINPMLYSDKVYSMARSMRPRGNAWKAGYDYIRAKMKRVVTDVEIEMHDLPQPTPPESYRGTEGLNRGSGKSGPNCIVMARKAKNKQRFSSTEFYNQMKKVEGLRTRTGNRIT
eukprot:sb/3473551/